MICCYVALLWLTGAQAENVFWPLLWEHAAEHISNSALLHLHPLAVHCVTSLTQVLWRTIDLNGCPCEAPPAGSIYVTAPLQQNIYLHPHLVDSAKSSLSIIHHPCSGSFPTVPLLASNIHWAETRKGQRGLKVNTNAECFSNPEVSGHFPNAVPLSADCHVACKCVLIKREFIRLIDSDVCAPYCN